MDWIFFTIELQIADLSVFMPEARVIADRQLENIIIRRTSGLADNELWYGLANQRIGALKNQRVPTSVV